MEEQFFTISKHGSTFRIKSAVTKNGRVAVACQGGVNVAARETGIPKATLSLHARSAYEVERAGEQSGLALGKPKGQAINHISRGRPVRSSPFQ
jgi:hypothetical protein